MASRINFPPTEVQGQERREGPCFRGDPYMPGDRDCSKDPPKPPRKTAGKGPGGSGAREEALAGKIPRQPRNVQGKGSAAPATSGSDTGQARAVQACRPTAVLLGKARAADPRALPLALPGKAPGSRVPFCRSMGAETRAFLCCCQH